MAMRLVNKVFFGEQPKIRPTGQNDQCFTGENA